ncbi:hypothetical protein KQX54_020759 [Cotesia glomerata]|uniref:Uncharacterized protein n=1 Tax=Cotesia glomerata TaxID=32391 RepID=A0AAV7I4X3_COTGL|nr:hypothetical protein KQX54_020759 [Cotesia glomerata]
MECRAACPCVGTHRRDEYNDRDLAHSHALLVHTASTFKQLNSRTYCFLFLINPGWAPVALVNLGHALMELYAAIQSDCFKDMEACSEYCQDQLPVSIVLLSSGARVPTLIEMQSNIWPVTV